MFEAVHCYIKNVHVYDGVQLLEEFDGLPSGSYLTYLEMIPNPPFQDSVPPNMKVFKPPRVIRSSIGLSVYACSHYSEYKDQDDFYGNWPPGELTIAGAAANLLLGKRVDRQTGVIRPVTADDFLRIKTMKDPKP